MSKLAVASVMEVVVVNIFSLNTRSKCLASEMTETIAIYEVTLLNNQEMLTDMP